jgi:glycosyltransferase EpsD
MPKVIFISNTAIFSRFNIPFMRWFKQQGWQVDYASDGEIDIPDADRQFTISIKRSPYRFDNIRAYFQLKKIITENNYNIIHCHTPMGGILGRLVAMWVGTGVKVLYTAHGFHFYRKAPLKNWLIYYPAEKYFAKYTDVLITINEEDYNLAVEKFSQCKKIYKINGVGVDLERFHLIKNKQELRKSMGYGGNEFIILYIAEFTANKNHLFLLNQIRILRNSIPNLKLLFAGSGDLMDRCKKAAIDLDISNITDFLEYRSDIDKLCGISDIAVSPSRREGLPIGIIEALASGLPIVCSKIRGHVDVVVDGRNGFLFDLNYPNQFNESIIKLYNNIDLRSIISYNNAEDAMKYSVDIALNRMANIYKEFM